MKQSKVFNNAKWIVMCKFMQSVLQLVVGMISARYLGPSNYGLINYAASIVAFVLPIMRLGLDATLVREYVETPEKQSEIMGTSLVMNLCSAVFCVCGVVAFSAVTNANEKTTIIVCGLYSLSLIFAAAEMIQYWFQYKLLSKYSSVIMLGAYFFVSAYKIFLLVTQKSVYWFALTHSIEYGIISVGLYGVYCKKGGRLKFSFSLIGKLLKNSKYYILAALMLVVIQNTDHVMITQMVGTKANGYYSAGITTAGIFQFVYTAILDSYRPLILENKRNDQKAYIKSMTSLYSITLYLSLAQSIVFTIMGKLIVWVLYGSAYAATVTILRVVVWYLTFAMMGSVRNIWILAEQKQKCLWIINLSGALFNVVLNAALIPIFGAVGAAVASLLTQIFANFILGFIWKPLKENNKIILQSLNPKFALQEGKVVVKMLLKRK